MKAKGEIISEAHSAEDGEVERKSDAASDDLSDVRTPIMDTFSRKRLTIQNLRDFEHDSVLTPQTHAAVSRISQSRGSTRARI